MTNVDLSPKEALEQFFGFTAFKGDQEAIVQSVLDRKDTFVIMPTGGGKSLCYQLPALMSEGTAIVVSPLIALMKNQVDLLRGFGGENGVAHFLNSSLTRNEAAQVKNDIRAGITKLLYVAPESLTKKENVEFLTDIQISFFAIDEAHCISEWGHDFRPEYRRLRTIFNEIKRVPMIALTATATEKVQEDILKNLDIPEATTYKDSFNRPNLYYEVRPKKDVAREIIRFVKQHSGRSGIIYCLSRKKVEEIAETLVVNGIKALPYHAGMDASQRASHQDRFLMEDVDVIVATIAFGMGIDKPDVRFVIHHDVPKSLESYYQETGRAGRDGGEGKCITFYSYKDIEKLEKFLQGKPVAEQEIGRQLLADTVSYAETGMCRRKYLLHYFGEQLPGDNCGACDNCNNPKDHFEAKDDLVLVLNAVKESKERHRARFICDLLTGNETSEIKNYKGDKLKAYGSGSEHESQHWMAVVRQANVGGYLHKDIESYGNLSLTEEGKKFLKKPVSITFTKEREIETDDTPDDDIVVNGKGGGAADERLMKMLKELRHTMAKKNKLAPYVIFQDPALEEMTVRYPITLEELTLISGVGPGKAQKYGTPFVELIADYVEENEIERADETVVRSVMKKSSNKVHIIQNIDKRLSLESIAKAKGLSMDALLDEMETIVMSGTKLDINYHLDDVVEEDAQEEIMDYFRTAENDSIDEAAKEFDGDYSEEELRLMRLKFMSEVAN
ncbi:MAG: DNA helicase RecQ [Flavobacteriales bacterium]|jgi:ATP-dependent DNA helicase RecQ|nr:DNA helicase RecQ [Flavobacteriales bacterium]MBK6892477.1 DNA helicase RecQ [Flavobacteriales bacterium]MBK7246617.1 DNA helicase RecQ [Flavobacteriales bacterium]MBK9597652.1 DNA helicase RecQ [Flavobacteriales bacterium]QQS72294.1 MAG: DNA helicase RecQ [Flavobacteriales bacterium]